MRSKNRKQRGSVLLTVVFVMSILIVFLFGTIVLSMAANNRAHVNYSSAQTGITARAVAESAIKAIGNTTAEGKAYSDAIARMEPGDTLHVGVELSGTNASSFGHVDDVEISYAGKKKYYDIVKEDWQERDVLKFTSKVNMAGVESGSSIYVIKHFKEDVESQNRGGAGFVTVAGASVPSQTSIFGGAYISLPTLDDAQTKFKYEDKSFDRTLRGLGDINEQGEIASPNGGGAKEIGYVNAFKPTNTGSVLEADCYINSHLYVHQLSEILFPSDKTGIAVMGDMYFSGAEGAANLHYTYKGKREDEMKFNEIPFVYVDGRIYGGVIKLGNKDVLPEKQFPLNVFCGSIDLSGGAGESHVLACNLYCMDSDGSSTIKPSSNKVDSSMYIWTKSLVTNIKTSVDKNIVNGEICSNGNLSLGNVVVKGDVRVAGNLTITDPVTINGNVVVGGNIFGVDKITLADGKSIYGNAVAEEMEVEVSSAKWYYAVHELHLAEDGKYKDRNNNNLNVDGLFTDGELNEDATYSNGESVNGAIEGRKLYYTVARWYDPNNPWNPPENCIEGSIAPLLEGDPGLCMVPDTDNMFYVKPKIKMETITKNGEGKYVAEGDLDDSMEKIPSASITVTITPTPVDNPSDDYLNMMGEDSIYPQYARRPVIVGKEKIDGFDTSETKIVNTMEDILKNIANPYASTNLPSELKAKYQEMVDADGNVKNEGYVSGVDKTPKNKFYCRTEEDIKAYNDGEALNTINDDGSYGTPSAGDNNVLYIKKDCVLDMQYGVTKSIVINPGSGNLLVVVKNLSMNAGSADPETCHIMVDDSQGGNVYFYIDKDGLMNVGGQNNMVTRTYWPCTKTDTHFKYNSNDTSLDSSYIDLGKLKVNDTDPFPNASPHLFVYGGKDSYLHFEGMSLLTANIISADLTVTIAANNDTSVKISSFYYDNVDIVKWSEDKVGDGPLDKPYFMIGCLNAKEVASKNIIKTVYIDDGSGHGGGGGSGDDEFWYYSLYYSEY